MKNRIAIWGAGKFGKYIFAQLKKQYDNCIVCFVDKNDNLIGQKIQNVEIIKPERLQSEEFQIDYLLISFTDGIDIYDQLLKFENIKVGIIKNRVFNQQLDVKDNLNVDRNIFWVKQRNKPLLKYLETNIVDYCNLNCKGCSHFSNLFNVGDMISFDSYCKDLELISNHVNLFQYRMLGGEILLNEGLIDYIKITRELLPNTEIWIVTNGILIPKQKEELFHQCKQNEIGIEISEYNPTTYLKDSIIESLKKYNIDFRFTEKINTFGKNIDIRGHADKFNAMKNCREHICHFFREGKIYKCQFEALGNKFFAHFELNIKLSGGIDIYDKELNWDKLIYQLENEPVEACKYCGNEIQYKWSVSNSPTMSDWTI